MTNDEYFFHIESKVQELLTLRYKVVTLASEIIGKTLFKEDLFYCASADRCIHLLDGYIQMLKERNMTCIGVLLRMQMDNCMRTYAAFIAGDRNAVIDCIFSGKPIRTMKDSNGNKLTDGYLKKELSKIDSQFEKVYDYASGYVHFSDKAFYLMLNEYDDEVLNFGIGLSLPEKRNDVLLDSIAVYTHFVNLHFRMLQAVADSKQRYDSICSEV